MNPDQCQQRPDGVWVCRDCGFGYELSPEAVVERLTGANVRARQAAEAVASRLDVAPAEGIWTPRQYLAHLADWFEIIAERIERTLTEDRPLIASYDQDRLAVERAYDTWDVPSTLDRLEAATNRSIAAIRAAGEAGWDRIGVRDDLGETAVSMFANDLVHELDHHLLDVTSGPVGRDVPPDR
jgi:DinB superfamily